MGRGLGGGGGGGPTCRLLWARNIGRQWGYAAGSVNLNDRPT